MSRDALNDIIASCSELRARFSRDCAYRTCHYRHSAVEECLRLAGGMASELAGKGKMSDSDLYRAICMFSMNFAEALRDREGDPRLYGALCEVDELALRAARKLGKEMEDEDNGKA